MTNKRKKQPLSPVASKLIEYIYVIIGAALIALAFNVLLLPNHVASGGVSGISTIINYLTGWNPAFIQWAFNIPLFLAGLFFLGYQFGLKTFVGTMLLPFFVYLTQGLEPWTHEPLVVRFVWRRTCGNGTWNRFSRQSIYWWHGCRGTNFA